MKNTEYAKIKGTNKIYIITKIIDNDVYLEYKNIKIKVNIDEIEKIPNEYINEDNVFKTSTKKVDFDLTLNKKEIIYEIMLRHKDKETALKELDSFIDQAILNHLAYVKIIHGIQGGIIRHATTKYLDNCPYILSHRFGEYHEGGFGVTIAYLKN